MGIQPLDQINAGDIILPEKGGNPLYVIAFERNTEKEITNIIGYQVLENAKHLSGGNVQEITAEDLKSGSLGALSLNDPAILISKNHIARVSVSEDAYYAEYFATVTNNFSTVISNIHDAHHNDDARIVDIESADTARIQDYSRFQTQVGGNGNEADAATGSAEPKRKYVKRKTSVGYQKTMYLEDAVAKDILSKKLYFAFIQEANNFTTLQDVFDALETNDLNRFAQQISHSPFPAIYAVPPEGNGEDYLREIERREDKLNEDTVVSQATDVSLEEAKNRGLISEKTFEILSKQEDVLKNCDTLYDAFVTVGAHAYYLDTFKNPVSGYKLGKNIRAALIEDVENAYDKFAGELKEQAFREIVKEVRNSFFEHVMQRGASVIDAPDLSQSYSRAAKKQAKSETAAIAANRPAKLEM